MLLASPALALGLWIAVNRIEWLGPWVADGLRAVIGKEAVTEIENIAYGVQDRFYQYIRQGEKPKAYWEVPAASPALEPEAEKPAPQGTTGAVKIPPFAPSPVGPVHEAWSAPGDGHWLTIPVPDLPKLEPHLFKTLLHPDKNRSWAELFVVAIDLRRSDIHLVAGSQEPVATEPAALGVERPARIPDEHHDRVLAAFNGGFKTEHGAYGMRVGGVTLVAPRDEVCAVALFKDESIRVAPWHSMKELESDMLWWRQTPNCMYADNVVNPNLGAGNSKKWGATLDGETVIRRSAIGIDASGNVLFVGISNHTTASAIADGMNHAGAVSVAQLDVNFSYPKFVLFQRPPGAAEGGDREAVALAEGFEFSTAEYIRERARRDFFYVTPKSLRSPAEVNR
jgi:hypothetical protein